MTGRHDEVIRQGVDPAIVDPNAGSQLEECLDGEPGSSASVTIAAGGASIATHPEEPSSGRWIAGVISDKRRSFATNRASPRSGTTRSVKPAYVEGTTPGRGVSGKSSAHECTRVSETLVLPNTWTPRRWRAASDSRGSSSVGSIQMLPCHRHRRRPVRRNCTGNQPVCQGQSERRWIGETQRGHDGSVVRGPAPAHPQTSWARPYNPLRSRSRFISAWIRRRTMYSSSSSHFRPPGPSAKSSLTIERMTSSTRLQMKL